MKKASIIYTFVIALIAFGQAAWAQDVSTDSELRDAIQNDGANITVTADIDLSNSTLSIASGTTVTIDLGGHTLDRHLTKRGEGGGQVITVRSGATLNLSNGTLKGGWGGNSGGIANEGGTVNLTSVFITGCTGDDRGGGICNLSGGTLTMTGGSITNNTCYDHGDPAGGGGIFNAEGTTMTLTGVTITGNEDVVCGGGGICNFGTLYLNGCTIQNNTARTSGGGIWSGNEKHLLKMQGANIITDNIAGGITSNLFMEERRWITITGSITGSQIGITLDVAPNQFTNGFPTYHSDEDPNTFFICDRPETDSLALVPNEPYVLYVGDVMVVKKNLDGKVPYIERSWDDTNKKVVSTTKILTEEIALNATPSNETQYKRLKNSPGSYLDLGTEDSELHEYYVVSDDEVNFESLIVIGPNVHIILCDNAWLHLQDAVGVESGDTVYFHAQSSGPSIGKLTSASIGGPANDGVNIEIHGGRFNLQGNTGCAAIGGQYDTNGDITIYDGRIKATGGDDAAGIGGGYMCEDYGKITIYGGVIDATGSAGIGGGNSCINGKLTIWDGAITAHGIGESAGIGSNQYSGDYGAGTITINGGYVRAYGDDYGAGIGGGDGIRGGTLNVNGGHVEAYGGTDAAGIGGGEGGNGGIVNITGGYVYAEGNDNGAGIGGGEDGAGANVTINGGVVIAKAGGNDDHPCAIGRGSDAENSDGQLTFADNLGVFITTNLYRSVKANRVSDCRNFQYVQINKCAHGGATCTDNGSSVSVDCSYCYASTMPYTFNANGNWNDGSNWFSGFMPHDGNDVAVKAFATIPADYCANVGNIALQDGGTITIADGGQLIHSNAGVTATVQKAIVGHGGDDNNGWNFIASPMVTNIIPTFTNGFLTDNYDLYYYDEPTHYWMNHKGSDHGHFDIEPQKGYLYASYDTTTLSMTGTLQPSNEAVTIGGLSHEASDLTGFNLVGNPFASNATITGSCYTIQTQDGKQVIKAAISPTVGPCEGVMVQADAENDSVTFTKVTPALQANQPSSANLQITLSQVPEPVEGPARNSNASSWVGVSTSSTALALDNAIVSFNEGNALEKFYFGNHAKIYIPQGGKDYAIASVSAGRDGVHTVSTTEVPVNFKANENGTYTITVNPEGVDMAYLHLIDNMTGADVDLLVSEPVEGPASYTFTAKTTDYASRFKLVFASVCEDADGDNEPFAFYSNGSWIITNEGEATLQVIDMTGRILSSETVSGNISKAIDAAPGVYILKLNDKVQKIVIR